MMPHVHKTIFIIFFIISTLGNHGVSQLGFYGDGFEHDEVSISLIHCVRELLLSYTSLTSLAIICLVSIGPCCTSVV